MKLRHSASKLYWLDLKKYPTTSQLSKTKLEEVRPKPPPVIYYIDFQKIKKYKDLKFEKIKK